MARRNSRSRSAQLALGLVRAIALMSSVAFVAAVLSKLWPL